MSDTDDSRSSEKPLWQKRQDAQEQKVVTWARHLLAGHGNELYRQILINFLGKRPRGLHRLERAEQRRLNQILEQSEVNPSLKP
ncbi:hypothetical protein Lepto7375DRAFT_0563 [Leptolyngbya sp. PCC 7375]|nr:hypothetical protein Lepto7375DRAFT_0563 [Leptolyngbya sp. PCC 7375]